MCGGFSDVVRKNFGARGELFYCYLLFLFLMIKLVLLLIVLYTNVILYSDLPTQKQPIILGLCVTKKNISVGGMRGGGSAHLTTALGGFVLCPRNVISLNIFLFK